MNMLCEQHRRVSKYTTTVALGVTVERTQGVGGRTDRQIGFHMYIRATDIEPDRYTHRARKGDWRSGIQTDKYVDTHTHSHTHTHET